MRPVEQVVDRGGQGGDLVAGGWHGQVGGGVVRADLAVWRRMRFTGRSAAPASSQAPTPAAATAGTPPSSSPFCTWSTAASEMSVPTPTTISSRGSPGTVVASTRVRSAFTVVVNLRWVPLATAWRWAGSSTGWAAMSGEDAITTPAGVSSWAGSSSRPSRKPPGPVVVY